MLFGLYAVFSWFEFILSGLLDTTSLELIGSKKSDGKRKWELYKIIYRLLKENYCFVLGVLILLSCLNPKNCGFNCNEIGFLFFLESILILS